MDEGTPTRGRSFVGSTARRHKSITAAAAHAARTSS
jgi:hypothetical protein